jgi:hypothetical protein
MVRGIREDTQEIPRTDVKTNGIVVYAFERSHYHWYYAINGLDGTQFNLA